MNAIAVRVLADTQPATLEAFSKQMPKRIEDALEFPILKEMIKASGEEIIQAYVEFELIKLADLVSVGGNLSNTQVPFIAETLIRTYPNETLADFKLCFQRGAMGNYGEIFRLDGVVIGLWMKAYLEEKYQVIENKLMKEKENLYDPIPKVEGPNSDKHQAWLNKLKEAVDGVAHKMKVPDLPEEMIKEIGHPNYKPPAKTRGYAYFNVRGVQIYATSQEHAESLVDALIKNGDIEEV